MGKNGSSDFRSLVTELDLGGLQTIFLDGSPVDITHIKCIQENPEYTTMNTVELGASLGYSVRRECEIQSLF